MPALYLHVLTILGIIALTTGQEQLLMVFGGQFGEVPTLFPKYRDVHLLSLDGGPPLPWCLQSLNKFPREFGNLWESCPATLGADKLPHVCGGSISGCDIEAQPYPCETYENNDLCYRYDPALDTWTVSGNISSSADLYFDQHCAINSVPEIIITGSCDPYNPAENGPCSDETSTIFTGDGETFANLPPIPVALRSTCVVALDDNNLFVTGGTYIADYGYSNKSYLFRSDTLLWEELPGLLTPREYHACARVHNSNGDEEVVVAGGFYCEDDNCPRSLDLVDIYNLGSGQWREGTSLPLTLESTTVVPNGESFLLVGGYHIDNLNENTDTIYKYEVLSGSWTLLDTRIPYNVTAPIAMMVDLDIFPSC